jgi:hypothetical protein
VSNENELLIASAEAEALYEVELAAMNDDITYKNKELERMRAKLELKKSEYIDWFLDDCEGNNGYTTGAGLTQKCRPCGNDQEPNSARNACIASTASKEEKMVKDRDRCEQKNAFWQITDEADFSGRCVVCSGAYEPGYAMSADGTMGDAMSCQKTAATLAQEKKDAADAAAAVQAAAATQAAIEEAAKVAAETAAADAAAIAATIASYQTMFNTAKAYLDGKKGVKSSGSIRLGPGTYGYELSGAGGGGGGGGSSKAGCGSKKNGGDGGNGELKAGNFTLDNVANVEFSVGGNTNTAGDCGYGGSDNGAPGEDSTIKYDPGNDAATITAVGGGGGKWTDNRRKNTPSGNGAAGGEGGGKGRPDPQNGAPGWFILTSYAP